MHQKSNIISNHIQFYNKYGRVNIIKKEVLYIDKNKTRDRISAVNNRKDRDI